MPNLSKSQINKLGERLKEDLVSTEDLILLDQFRATYTESFNATMDILQNTLKFKPTGRKRKTTQSIIKKLKRETGKLSSIQDIAGCRVIVENIEAQEKAIALINDHFEKIKIIDRRIKPKNHYRAVHIIVTIGGKKVEIQLRTILQDAWAEFSEKLSEKDPEIKYGKEHTGLKRFSDLIKQIEENGINSTVTSSESPELLKTLRMWLLS